MGGRIAGVCLAGALLLAGLATARSEEADFYAGKTIQLIVPFSPGGYYDVSSRILARFLQTELPGNPAVVVQNQPGGGGISAANRLGTSIAHDGLTLAVVSRGVPQLALLNDPAVKFDPLKLTWLGSLSAYNRDAHLLVVNKTSPIDSLQKARSEAFHLGAGVTGSTNTTFALIARDLLGLKVDVVRGFPGTSDIWLSMERGEVDGQLADLSGILTGRANLWKAGALRPLVQFGRRERLASLDTVPTARELVSDPDDRALLEFAELPFFMSLPFAAPPDIPEARAKLLQETFMKIARDPQFQKELQQAGIEPDPVDGAAVVESGARTNQTVRERFQKLLRD